jgi:hypothetical protein
MSEVVPTRPDMPEDCLNGRLGEIYQRRLCKFPRAFGWHALLAAATIRAPRSINDNIRTNLYCGLVGPTGSGKSSAIDQSLEVLGVSKDPRLFRAKYGSAEGMMPAIAEQIPPGSNCLLNPDELAHLLAKLNIDRSAFPSVINTAFYHDQQTGGTKGW